MVTSIFTRQVATRFGAIDSDAVADGAPLSAAVQLAASRAAHRLLVKRETVVAELYDQLRAAGESPAPGGVALPFWSEVGRWPIEKLRRRPFYDVSLGILVTNTEQIEVQYATRARPWVQNPSGSQLETLTGLGIYDRVRTTGLEGVVDGSDELRMYVRGTVSATLASTGSVGSPNVGTVARVQAGAMYPSGATTWNTTGTTLAYTHALVLLSGAGGIPVAEPQTIVGVRTDSVGQYLELFPGFDPLDTIRLSGTRYELRALPTWRLGGLTVITQERAL